MVDSRVVAAAVDAMCEKLINKLPECTRYTKKVCKNNFAVLMC